MNPYEQKQAARKARYEDRANRARQESAATHQQARDMASIIPFGQPILIGHHSETRDRNYRGRIHRKFERSFEAQKKAEHYDAKAEAVGKGGISSDDPEAVTKLQTKLDKAERQQELMKAANKAVRAAYKTGIREGGPADDIATFIGALKRATGHDFSEARARELMAPDFAGRRGFPDYALTNNNANIRRMKERMKSFEASAGAETTEREVDGVRVVENVEENRVQLFFDGKPAAEIRTALKSQGFRWARSNGCWQRHLNNAGRHAVRSFLETL